MSEKKQSSYSDSIVTRRQVLAGLAASVPIVLGGCASQAGPSTTRAAGGSAPVDVIVVGAGAIGCNTAWHLKNRGRRVLVIESRPEPASQSTPGAAGFVALWSGIHMTAWGNLEWQMEKYGIDFYTQLAKRTKADIGFAACGLAYIYTDPRAWKSQQPKIAKARKLGTDLQILNKEQAKKIAPFLQFDQLAGIAFDPSAIRVRAGDAIRELARELGQKGVQFQYNTHVAEFLRDGDRITGVRTGDGEIRANQVIVTAGAWSRPLLTKLGVNCPSTPYNETRYVSKPLDGLSEEMPLMIFGDQHNFYIRKERGALLIGGSDNSPWPADRLIDPDNPPPTCDHLPPDQAYRMRDYARATQRFMPLLDKADIANISSGMPTKSPDSHHIAGPVPGIAGLFAMSGCMEAGITHGPALGKILSEYAVDGKTEWDTSGFRFERFQS